MSFVLGSPWGQRRSPEWQIPSPDLRIPPVLRYYRNKIKSANKPTSMRDIPHVVKTKTENPHLYFTLYAENNRRSQH